MHTPTRNLDAANANSAVRRRHARWVTLALAAAVLGSGRLAAQLTNTPPQVATRDLDFDRDGVADFTQTATSEQYFGDSRTRPVWSHVWTARTTVMITAREGIEFLVGPDPGDPWLAGQPFLRLHLGDEIGPNPPEGWQWRALPDGIMTWREELYYDMAPWEAPIEGPYPTVMARYYEGALMYASDESHTYVGVRFRAVDGWHYGYVLAFEQGPFDLTASSLNPSAGSPIRPGELPWLRFTPQPWFDGVSYGYSVIWFPFARDLGYALEQTPSLATPHWAPAALPDPGQTEYRLPKGGAPLFFRLHKGTP